MDILVIGFALFAMFFGAGNLIFPASLGRMFASDWLLAGVSFSVTGVGLTLLAVISMSRKKGDIFNFTEIAGKRLGKLICLLIILCIGPVFALPRTSATSMEILDAVGISIPHILFATAFFGITLFFAIKPSGIIDVIGKYLTPLLLITLLALIIKGIIQPIGLIKAVGKTDAISTGLIEGYSTMDALAAIVFTPIIVKSVLSRGYEKNYMKMMLLSSLVAIVGLGFVYISLAYLGATTSSALEGHYSRVELLIYIAHTLLKSYGKFVLASAMTLACLTTSIGLTGSLSGIFERFLNGRVKENTIAVIICVISAVISVSGVSQIVVIAVPVLNFIYPSAILMILFNFFDIPKKFKLAISNTFSVTLIISLIQSLKDFVFTLENLNIFIPKIIHRIALTFDKVVNTLPLAKQNFPWVIPAMLVFVVSIVFVMLKKDNK